MIDGFVISSIAFFFGIIIGQKIERDGGMSDIAFGFLLAFGLAAFFFNLFTR